MSNRPYELVLFDVDHTLLDFEASEEHALKSCWELYFHQAVDFEVYAGAFRKINLSIWHEVESGKLKPTHVSEERARRSLRHFGFSGGDSATLGKRFARDWLPWQSGCQELRLAFTRSLVDTRSVSHHQWADERTASKS